MPHKDPGARAAYLKAWREKNAKDSNKRYYSKHRAKRLAYMAVWRAKNPDKLAAARARYVRSEEIKARHREYTRRDSAAMRARIIAAYGSACDCCSESRIEFLTIDHVGGGGAQERRAGITAPVLYRRIVKANFPPTYRVLCWNCNGSLGIHGYCPHHPDVRPVRPEPFYQRDQDDLPFRDVEPSA